MSGVLDKLSNGSMHQKEVAESMLLRLTVGGRAWRAKMVAAGAIAPLVTALAYSHSAKLLKLAGYAVWTLAKLADAGEQHCAAITAAGAIPPLLCHLSLPRGLPSPQMQRANLLMLHSLAV